MKMTIRILTGAFFVATLQAASAADIAGKITLKGTPPPERPVNVTDANCGKNRTTPLATRLYVVGSGGELADVFVHITDGLTGKTFEVPTQPVVLDQLGCEYVPYVLGLQTKQKLLVRNSDPTMHNVHPTPDPKSGNKEDNKAQMPKAKDLVFTFDKPEVLLRFMCNVHPWMFAYVGVVDHPYYAVTGKDGSFKIANVPPGTYTIEAFHRKAGKATQKVTVGNESQKADFTLEVPKAQ
jgi:hypothetical protein